MNTLRRNAVACGTVAAIAVAALWSGGTPPPLLAQGPGEPALEVVQVAPSVHLIAGDGSNIVVQTGSEGVVLVDSGTGERSADVIREIRRLTDQPIRFIINTTAHRDHVGGNGTISAAGTRLGESSMRAQAPSVVSGVFNGATRLAHENVLLRMSAPDGQVAPFDEALWPTESFVGQKDLYLNNEAIQIFHQPAAHSDGDSIVFFRRSDVIAAGPLIDTTRFPVIDVAAGGTVEGLIDGLNVLVDLAVPPTPLVWLPGGTQVVPGRGYVMEEADVIDYRDMVTIVRDVVRSQATRGLTLEEILASNATQGYNGLYGSDTGDWTTNMFVEAVYRTMAEEGR